MIILWLQNDLRLEDNPALNAALETAKAHALPLLPIYILDDTHPQHWARGAASRWWLHESLSTLAQSLKDTYALTLTFFKGPADTILNTLSTDTQAPISHIYWTRGYEPWRIARDRTIKDTLKTQGITAESFNGSLLFEPWTILKKDGTPYKVFTPFYRKGCLAGPPPRACLTAPHAQPYTQAATPNAATPLALTDLHLKPSIPWHTKLTRHWTPGENGAQKALSQFLSKGLNGYKTGRDFMSDTHTSRLSPHLHFGEISPHAVWHAAHMANAAHGLDSDTECFASELGWREFSYALLYHFPTLPEQNFQPKFNAFPWEDPSHNNALERWQTGQTGYPIVDAAMRELWETGTMHNRARMIAASFLTKHLRIDWRHGTEWFWDTLVDADLASNSASWQWVAGSGADAAPYFRIFNPITQGEKFDPDGRYTRRFVPELKALPTRYLFKPWDAPPPILEQANITRGHTYPHPIVDHKTARQHALDAFASTR